MDKDLPNPAQQLGSNQNVANTFFPLFYISIIEDVFFVMTDTFHKSGFKYHTNIIQRLVQVIEHNYVRSIGLLSFAISFGCALSACFVFSCR